MLRTPSVMKIQTDDPELVRLAMREKPTNVLSFVDRDWFCRSSSFSGGIRPWTDEIEFTEIVHVVEPEDDASYRERILIEYGKLLDVISPMATVAQYAIMTAAASDLDRVGAAYGVKRR